MSTSEVIVVLLVVDDVANKFSQLTMGSFVAFATLFRIRWYGATRQSHRPSFADRLRCLAYSVSTPPSACYTLPTSVNAVMLDGSIIDALERK